MADKYHSQQPYEGHGGAQYQTTPAIYQNIPGSGQQYPIPYGQQQYSRSPLAQQSQFDRYGSPTSPGGQLAPYQTQQRGASPRHNSQNQLTPYMEPASSRRSSSYDKRDHHKHRSSSHSQNGRPSLLGRGKSDHAFERGLGADVVGAAGGGYLGHKFGGGGFGGTVLGALVGGYAAHRAEQKHENHRKGKKERLSNDSDSSSEDSNLAYGRVGASRRSSSRRARQGRRGSAPPPILERLFPADAGRSRRLSRHARSHSRRRGHSSDSGSSSDGERRRRRR